MAIGDLYEFRIVTTFTDQTAINVRHYIETANTGTGATMLELAQSLDGLIAAAYKAVLSASAFYRGVGVRKVQPLPASAETSTIGAVGAGTVAGDPLPRQCSGIITLRTALAGPRARGRMYVAFPGEGDNDVDSTPTAGYIGRLTTLANLMDNTLSPGAGGNTTTLVPVVWSRVGLSINYITAVVPRDKWATQRRRGSFGHTNAAPF